MAENHPSWTRLDYGAICHLSAPVLRKISGPKNQGFYRSIAVDQEKTPNKLNIEPAEKYKE